MERIQAWSWTKPEASVCGIKDWDLNWACKSCEKMTGMKEPRGGGGGIVCLFLTCNCQYMGAVILIEAFLENLRDFLKARVHWADSASPPLLSNTVSIEKDIKALHEKHLFMRTQVDGCLPLWEVSPYKVVPSLYVKDQKIVEFNFLGVFAMFPHTIDRFKLLLLLTYQPR